MLNGHLHSPNFNTPSRHLSGTPEDDRTEQERIVEAEKGYAVVEKMGVAGAEAARLDDRRAMS